MKTFLVTVFIIGLILTIAWQRWGGQGNVNWSDKKWPWNWSIWKKRNEDESFKKFWEVLRHHFLRGISTLIIGYGVIPLFLLALDAYLETDMAAMYYTTGTVHGGWILIVLAVIFYGFIKSRRPTWVPFLGTAFWIVGIGVFFLPVIFALVPQSRSWIQEKFTLPEVVAVKDEVPLTQEQIIQKAKEEAKAELRADFAQQLAAMQVANSHSKNSNGKNDLDDDGDIIVPGNNAFIAEKKDEDPYPNRVWDPVLFPTDDINQLDDVTQFFLKSTTAWFKLPSHSPIGTIIMGREYRYGITLYVKGSKDNPWPKYEGRVDGNPGRTWRFPYREGEPRMEDLGPIKRSIEIRLLDEADKGAKVYWFWYRIGPREMMSNGVFASSRKK